MSLGKCAVYLALIPAGAIVPAAVGAPQTFNSALPVAADSFVFREQFLYRKATGDPGPSDRDLRVTGAFSVLGYGVSGKLAVFGVLPWLDKELEAATAAGRVTRGSTGFGDARLFSRYTIYRKDGPGRTFRLAPFLGVEMPTGNDDETDARGPLPAPLQPGSGSWDVFGGMVLTWQTRDFQVDAQASYKRNTEANDFEFGDEAVLDASVQYRVWPRELEAGVPGFLYAGLETNLRYADDNEIGGVEDPDSGGVTVSLSPGIQYVTKRWIIEGIVQVPVSRDLGGASLEDDFIVRAGFRLNF